MRSRLTSLIRTAIERGVRPYGYRLVRPASRYGIDPIADVTRLAGGWGLEIGLAVDVGANVGASALAYRAAWPACRVIAFEPNGETAGRLRANVGAVGGVEVVEAALSAQAGRAAFFVHDDAVLSSLNETTPYTERFGLKGRPVEVEVTTLDAYCRDRAIGRIGLLKIDAEGSDHDVLRGAEGLLRERRVDFVYCEFNSLDPEPAGAGSLMPIATLLGAHGYDFVASYNDYILTDGRLFSVSNALFAARREPPAQ